MRLHASMTWLLSVLTGFALSAGVDHFLLPELNHAITLNAPVPPARKSDTLRSLFGVNLSADFADLPCTTQGLALTGYIEHNQNALFVIAGKSGKRLYERGDLVEQKYPIVSDSSGQVLLRQAQNYHRLCLVPPSAGDNSAVPALPNFQLKTITTPYFSLTSVPATEKGVISYSISACSMRCRMILSPLGLESTDKLVAINHEPIDEHFSFKRLKSIMTAQESVDITIIRDEKIVDVTIKNKDLIARLISKE